MLHYLDVMIGFVFTLLVISLAVTAMVQAVPVYLRNMKGVVLHRGLADLMMRMTHVPQGQGNASMAQLEAMVGSILRDSLLAPPRMPLARFVVRMINKLAPGAIGDRPWATVVQREEFVRLLLDFVANDDPETSDGLKAVRDQIRPLLGIKTAGEAKAMLTNLRARIAELELEHHDWSSSKRADQAMLELLLAGPMRDFMAKLTGWYDQTIDRIDAAFTAGLRGWTTAVSLVLVLVLQLDSFDLMARLNVDSALRDRVVASAITAMDDGSVKPGGAPGAASEAKALECARLHVNRLGTAPDVDEYANCMGLAQAMELKLVQWPESPADWWDNWKADPLAILLQLVGMLLSAALLSL
ncbi:hypothetical protein, partial [Sandarakinorhabdus sp.]|uniref:hypothetical protein n=1 Tax=Sandarakinorhabdus sp. TaxID=1916663 RepID=UPI00286D83CC